MSLISTLEDIIRHSLDKNTYLVNMTDTLDTRNIAGISLVDADGLTVTNVVVQTVSYLDPSTGETIAGNKAFKFKIEDGVDGGIGYLTFKATLDDSDEVACSVTVRTMDR